MIESYINYKSFSFIALKIRIIWNKLLWVLNRIRLFFWRLNSCILFLQLLRNFWVVFQLQRPSEDFPQRAARSSPPKFYDSQLSSFAFNIFPISSNKIPQPFEFHCWRPTPDYFPLSYRCHWTPYHCWRDLSQHSGYSRIHRNNDRWIWRCWVREGWEF